MPRGSLFVELYNPWAGHDKWPGEFYQTGTAWSSGVLLNKTNSAGQPVWRLAITDAGSQATRMLCATADPERTVYFTDPTSLTGGANLGTQMHYTTVAGPCAPCCPADMRWSDPPEFQPTSSYVTTIGRRTDASEGGGLALWTQRGRLCSPPTATRMSTKSKCGTTPVRRLTKLIDPVTVDPPMDGFATPPAHIQPAIAIPIDVVLTLAGCQGQRKGKGEGKGRRRHRRHRVEYFGAARRLR